jgi:hypothetical protein
MKEFLVLLAYRLPTLDRLLGPGGTRVIVAGSLLMKLQRLIVNRSRRRAPTALHRLGSAQSVSRNSRHASTAPGYFYRTPVRAATKLPGVCHGLSRLGLRPSMVDSAGWADRIVVAVRDHCCHRYRQVRATVAALPRFYQVAKCKTVEHQK